MFHAAEQVEACCDNMDWGTLHNAHHTQRRAVQSAGDVVKRECHLWRGAAGLWLWLWLGAGLAGWEKSVSRQCQSRGRPHWSVRLFIHFHSHFHHFHFHTHTHTHLHFHTPFQTKPAAGLAGASSLTASLLCTFFNQRVCMFQHTGCLAVRMAGLT